MLYQSVRPKTLNQVVGNSVAKATFKRMLDMPPDKQPHVILLVGEAGCGKTTLARIMAKELGCDNPIEKNAAAKNERGIDMTADLSRHSNMSPLGGGSRVTILDECHQLTSAAQGSLLKILEDVREHDYYFLCTTDPQKLLKTILTRCDKIEVKRLNDKQLIEVLEDAIGFLQEQTPEGNELPDVSNEILSDIASRAEGCPRSALVLLEKVVGLSDDEAYQILGNYTVGNKHAIDICKLLVDGRKGWGDITSAYKKIPKEELEPEGMRRAVMGYLKACMMNNTGAKAGVFADMLEEMMENTYSEGEPRLLLCLFRAKEVGS